MRRRWCDLKQFTDPTDGPATARTRDDVVLLCVSRLVPRKRVDVLVDAFAAIADKFPNARCVIVGSGPEEAPLRARCEALGVSSRVEFAGFAQDVRFFLLSSDIYVSPSEREGLPLTILEEMAVGLPCVVTDIGGNNELVVHEATGLLVPSGSPDALVRVPAHPDRAFRSILITDSGAS